jgi:pyruvate/2-oxoacid:ferredoxin oxidoreductase alpha subunit
LVSAIEGSTEVLVVEMNLGQVCREVQRLEGVASFGAVRLLSKVGGEVVTPAEIEYELKKG